LEAQIERLRAQNRWTEAQLVDIEKQALRLLYEAATRSQEAKDE
jgi:hypothetical protein